MVELLFLDGLVTFRDLVYSASLFDITSENQINMHLQNDEYSFFATFIANETTINGVLQTSAQMIYDTLNPNA
jgi:hypothetical protein